MFIQMLNNLQALFAIGYAITYTNLLYETSHWKCMQRLSEAWRDNAAICNFVHIHQEKKKN